MKRFAAFLTAALLCLTSASLADTGAAVPDIDLTKMSDTFVYAQVFNMMVDPEAYIGKMIRISGWFGVYIDSVTGNIYTSCVIPDATACCSQGLEFVWEGDHVYPDDYPALGTTLTVTGTFGTYMEGEYMYIQLSDAEVTWEDM